MHIATGKLRILIVALDVVLLLVGWKLNAISAFMLRSASECNLLGDGIICPACGGTRCVYHFVSGNFRSAFSYHPVVFCIIIYLILLLILWNLDFLFGVRFAKKIHKWMVDYRTIIVIAVCYVVIGLSRNFVGDWSHLYC